MPFFFKWQYYLGWISQKYHLLKQLFLMKINAVWGGNCEREREERVTGGW